MRDDSQGFIARSGAVVHGPEIIDSGCALRLINYLKKLGSVTALLGWTMGRVAAIDAGLEDVISIRPRRRPSQSIQDLEATSDVNEKAADSNRLRRKIRGSSLRKKGRSGCADGHHPQRLYPAQRGLAET